MVGKLGHCNRVDVKEEQDMEMQKKKKSSRSIKSVEISGQVEIGLHSFKEKRAILKQQILSTKGTLGHMQDSLDSRI